MATGAKQKAAEYVHSPVGLKEGWRKYFRAPLKTLDFLRRPLAHGCANRNQSWKTLILKKNQNDAFRFSCALKT
jgi:hypothetical protein